MFCPCLVRIFSAAVRAPLPVEYGTLPSQDFACRFRARFAFLVLLAMASIMAQRLCGESAYRRGSVQTAIPRDCDPVWPSIYAAYLEVAFAGRDARASVLTLLRMGFTQLPQSPAALVRSYRTVSPLPVLPGEPSAVYFLLHLPACHHDWPLASILSLWSPDLPQPSLPWAATTRPTHRRPVCPKTTKPAHKCERVSSETLTQGHAQPLIGGKSGLISVHRGSRIEIEQLCRIGVLSHRFW